MYQQPINIPIAAIVKCMHVVWFAVLYTLNNYPNIDNLFLRCKFAFDKLSSYLVTNRKPISS